MSPDVLSPRRPARPAAALIVLLALSACQSLPPSAADPADPARPGVAATPAGPQAAPACERPQPGGDAATARDQAGRQLLRWQDELRGLTPEALAARLTRLGAETPGPAHSVQLALVLLATRNPGDAARAQGLLEGLVRSSEPAAAPWADWAALLAARAAEQRRLEDALDRLAQQQREQQKKLDQTTEKLEALKAIERSLAPRRSAPGASR